MSDIKWTKTYEVTVDTRPFRVFVSEQEGLGFHASCLWYEKERVLTRRKTTLCTSLRNHLPLPKDSFAQRAACLVRHHPRKEHRFSWGTPGREMPYSCRAALSNAIARRPLVWCSCGHARSTVLQLAALLARGAVRH